MELPFASFEMMEMRSTIRVGMIQGKTAKKIYVAIPRLYGSCMTIQQVRNWRRDFLAGRTSLVDKPCFLELFKKLFSRGLERIVYRFSKCLDSQGIYVKK